MSALVAACSASRSALVASSPCPARIAPATASAASRFRPACSMSRAACRMQPSLPCLLSGFRVPCAPAFHALILGGDQRWCKPLRYRPARSRYMSLRVRVRAHLNVDGGAVCITAIPSHRPLHRNGSALYAMCALYCHTPSLKGRTACRYCPETTAIRRSVQLQHHRLEIGGFRQHRMHRMVGGGPGRAQHAARAAGLSEAARDLQGEGLRRHIVRA